MQSQEQPPVDRRSDRLAIWLVIPLTLTFVGLLVVFFGLFHTTTVDGDSMLPTLRPADHVLVTKSYDHPARGDVVVVHIPDSSGQMHDLVKRIVAVGGDTISVKDDVAYVNGARENERGILIDPNDSANVGLTRVPEGSVFLMGDNRPVSFDSRFFGAVPLSEVQGRVVAVFAPITRLRAVR